MTPHFSDKGKGFQIKLVWFSKIDGKILECPPTLETWKESLNLKFEVTNTKNVMKKVVWMFHASFQVSNVGGHSKIFPSIFENETSFIWKPLPLWEKWGVIC